MLVSAGLTWILGDFSLVSIRFGWFRGGATRLTPPPNKGIRLLGVPLPRKGIARSGVPAGDRLEAGPTLEPSERRGQCRGVSGHRG
jgi:hypothetical protein